MAYRLGRAVFAPRCALKIRSAVHPYGTIPARIRKGLRTPPDTRLLAEDTAGPPLDRREAERGLEAPRTFVETVSESSSEVETLHRAGPSAGVGHLPATRLAFARRSPGVRAQLAGAGSFRPMYASITGAQS